MLVRAARSAARNFTVTRVVANNGMPGSFLNGPEGRTIPKTNNIGPESAETAYNSHEYYNHDKVSFYDAIADCNHMRVVPPEAGMKDYKPKNVVEN
ncbi:Oidioi.mRNA.OKI2018_I69.chr2.g8214.t1.cds [Oikopleura dioica]|uniref:Oidioi.mRNA.OKI2018_I69.chr2.g8214.t1.cds n=1 Tax=Oikopleura dioica TaxID=34765 RepID=A0ABN7TGL2_OIKDI|nr:Oidioi.mRNA.OKI2018_I69.chr2.g8214.t1.cds [Oikopleura dioica]